MDKKVKLCVTIDVPIPGDCRISEKEIEKIEKIPEFEERTEEALVAEKG